MKLLSLSGVVLAMGIGPLTALAACSSSSDSGSDAGGSDGSQSADTGGGGDGSAGDTGGGGDPTVAITSPMANAQVTLQPPTDTVPVAFAVTNFTLRDANTCNSLPHCGHVHLFVDGDGCTPDGGLYNNFGSMSPLDADLTKCAMANGMHTVRVELHNDNHTVFTGADGGSVSASVTFTASGG